MEQDPGKEFGDLRRDVLAQITESVELENYNQVNQIASQQTLLRPVDVAEYMNVIRKRHIFSNEALSGRWEAGLWNYLGSIDEQLTEPEIEAIKRVKTELRDAEFGRIALGIRIEETGPFYVPETVGPEETEEEIEHWELTEFEVDGIDKESFDRIRTLWIFRRAEVQAEAGHFERAVRIVSATPYLIEEEKRQARKVLDWFLSTFAEELAVTGFLDDATYNINKYASDEFTARRMRSALDRFVYAFAEQQAANGLIDESQATIKQYASSLARCEAMLRRIGRYD